MPSLEQHCEHCQWKLGKPFREVNIWLDACFEQFNGNLDHRNIRHNMEGVETVRKMWGDEAAKAAILHIRLDWGNIPEENIPKDQTQATAFRESIIASYAKKK